MSVVGRININVCSKLFYHFAFIYEYNYLFSLHLKVMNINLTSGWMLTELMNIARGSRQMEKPC